MQVTFLAILAFSQDLSKILEAHKNSREQIFSIHCLVDLQTEVHRKNSNNILTDKAKGEYWIFRKKQREIIEEHGNISDGWWDGNIRIWKNKNTTSNSARFFNKNSYPSAANHRTHPLTNALYLVAPPESNFGIPLEQFLNQIQGKPKLTLSKEGDEAVQIISVEFKGQDRQGFPTYHWELDFYLAPKYNFLITKIVSRLANPKTTGGNSYQKSQTAHDFKQISPGIFFPVTLKGEGLVNGTVEETWGSKITIKAINKPISYSVFESRLPENTILLDGISGTSYKVDSSGKPVSEKESSKRNIPSPPLDGPLVKNQEPTKSEPTILVNWLAAGFFSLFILATAFYLILKSTANLARESK